MTGSDLVLFILLAPFVGAAIIPIFYRWPNLREAVTLITAVVLLFAVVTLLTLVAKGASPGFEALQIVPGMSIAFKVEPLGMLFAVIASGLWIVNSIYSIGYMRGNGEVRQTQFYVCFAIAIGSVMCIAFSANLFSLFLFYEVLTLSTYPLVTHKADEAAVSGGRTYLLLLVGTSTLLFLPAVIWTYAVAGTLDFAPGGILAGKADDWVVGMLLILFIFGIGKAAVMPVHFWLPAAMVAPTPVSALLHAVAVVKAGVFSVLKIIVYIFGLDVVRATPASDWLLYIAAFTVIAASLIAMTQDNLKKRLAYSTVSQLSYIVVGALLATRLGIVGGAMHIATHAVGKITLFFCAGAIYTAAHKTEISQLSGWGRAMPLTFLCFTIGTISIIGLPPFGGVWSKWYLALGALEAHQLAIVAVLMLSSLLNIAYLLPIPLKAFFGKPGDDVPEGVREAPDAILIAIVITSLACLALFFFATPLYELVSGIVPEVSKTASMAVKPL